MTSKEALNYLLVNSEELYNQYEEDEKFYLDAVELYNIVLKDLDRLEKLEKVIEILKKALLLNVKEVRGVYYVLGYDNNYCLTKEEYELLKGVLENDSN
ncbi:MAG: hypothetical protein SO148_00110 [Candidatus Onthovivens sp.]|nr:hypothetical protein [Candidatus Onthovivens sp.]